MEDTQYVTSNEDISFNYEIENLNLKELPSEFKGKEVSFEEFLEKRETYKKEILSHYNKGVNVSEKIKDIKENVENNETLSYLVKNSKFYIEKMNGKLITIITDNNGSVSSYNLLLTNKQKNDMKKYLENYNKLENQDYRDKSTTETRYIQTDYYNNEYTYEYSIKKTDFCANCEITNYNFFKNIKNEIEIMDYQLMDMIGKESLNYNYNYTNETINVNYNNHEVGAYNETKNLIYPVQELSNEAKNKIIEIIDFDVKLTGGLFLLFFIFMFLEKKYDKRKEKEKLILENKKNEKEIKINKNPNIIKI